MRRQEPGTEVERLVIRRVIRVVIGLLIGLVIHEYIVVGAEWVAGPRLPPDAQGCVDITSARLDLIVASTSDQARPAADTLEKWSPPDNVKDAIEHLVEAGGGQINDPGFNDANSAIEQWVKETCPT